MCLLANGSKSHIFPLHIIFQKLQYFTYIALGGIVKFANSKEAVVKWGLGQSYQSWWQVLTNTE